MQGVLYCVDMITDMFLGRVGLKQQCAATLWCYRHSRLPP